MLKFNLHDETLYYLYSNEYQWSLVSDRKPSYFEWVKDGTGIDDYVTYTHMSLENGRKNNLILLESSSIIPQHVKYVLNNRDKFGTIYTHNSELLKLPDTKWIPGGGIWVGTKFGGGEFRITPKRKLCSFVSSNKTMCPMHSFRLELARNLSTINNKIDYYGTAFDFFVKSHVYLQDYMYSIIIENHIDDLYFTEKILNCFASGTIPIYCGARYISSVFHPDGVLEFNTVGELLDKLNLATKQYYKSNLDAVRANFERCKEFTCVEDFMWENYMKDKYEHRNTTR